MDRSHPENINTIWPTADTAHVPFRVYRDPALYAAEMERIFYGPTWNYVGLECEVRQPGDYRRIHIGEREVLLLRNGDGALTVVENRCAHRGAQICQAQSGNCGNALICPYHQWTYDLDGALTGMPFRRGIKGKGGMPDDFDLKDHGLRRLPVETLNGVVFASFDEAMPPMRGYLGPEMEKYFTRIFDGRPLRVLGYQRQMIDCNWKLVVENFKDPYHAGILHLFLVSFGLFRLDQKSASVIDDSKGHSVVLSHRGSEQGREEIGGVKIAAPDFVLSDPRLLTSRKEFPDDVTATIQALFPNIIVQAQSNTLAMRHAVPKGVGRTELIWTFFGYADDDEEMTTMRLRQANLMGVSGYVTVDDAEVLEFSQVGLSGAPGDAAVVLELGGHDTGSHDHMVTESLIRGFYARYRDIMDMAQGTGA